MVEQLKKELEEELKKELNEKKLNEKRKTILTQALRSKVGRQKILSALLRPVIRNGLKHIIKSMCLSTELSIDEVLFFDVEVDHLKGTVKFIDKLNYSIKVVPEGDKFMAYDSDKFINIQESDCYVFGDTQEEAIQNFKNLYKNEKV